MADPIRQGLALEKINTAVDFKKFIYVLDLLKYGDSLVLFTRIFLHPHYSKSVTCNLENWKIKVLKQNIFLKIVFNISVDHK